MITPVSSLQAVLQQAAASGLTNPALIPSLTNPALIPGLLQGMQQNLATTTTSSASSGEVQLPTHLSMMIPSQQSVRTVVLTTVLRIIPLRVTHNGIHLFFRNNHRPKYCYQLSAMYIANPNLMTKL